MVENKQEFNIKELSIKLQVLTNALKEERKKSQNYSTKLQDYEELLIKKDNEIININKVKTTQYEITFTLVVNISDNLPYTYDSCDSGNISYASIGYSFSGVNYSSISGSDNWYNNGNNKFTYSFTISSDVERPTINIDFTVNVYRVNLTTPQYEVRVDNDVSYVNNTVPSNCPFGSIYHFGDAMGISGNVNRVVSNGDTIDVYIRLNGH